MGMSRKHDHEIEGIVSGFLDKYFYSKVAHREKLYFSRWTDREHQLLGIDVTLGNVNIDEKCKCYGCMNSLLKCPSFEISFEHRQMGRLEGWFVNKELKTDYYAILGVFASAATAQEFISEKQLQKVDILLVSKQDVVDFASSEGLGRDELLKISEELVEEGKNNCFGDAKLRRTFPSGKLWITHSTNFIEKPVNLVIPRETLCGFGGTRHFVVTRQTYKLN